MTDKDFIKYLGRLLFDCGEDACSICKYNPLDGVCDNMETSLKKEVALNDDICLEGMRLYAEQQTERKDN